MMYSAACLTLAAPDNGDISCLLRSSDGRPTVGDSCSFTCDDGFELSGSSVRTCQRRRRNTRWSGQPTICTKGKIN